MVAEFRAVMATEAALRAARAPFAAGAGLRVVAEGDIAALFASAPARGGVSALLGRVRARAAAGRALVARQKLLEDLMAFGDVLPAGAAAPLREADARVALVANADALRATLEGLEGRVQYQLRVDWNPAEALRRFADAPELSRALAAPRADRGFGAALRDAAEALRARLGAAFAASIADACEDAVGLPLDGPEALVNLACLAARPRVPALEAALERIDATWPEGLRIRMIGPAPAVSFAALALERPTAAALGAAAQRLGLDTPPADPAAATAAFRAKARALGAAEGEAAAFGPLRDAATLLARVATAREALARAGLPTAAPVLLTPRRDGDAAARAEAAA